MQRKDRRRRRSSGSRSGVRRKEGEIRLQSLEMTVILVPEEGVFKGTAGTRDGVNKDISGTILILGVAEGY